MTPLAQPRRRQCRPVRLEDIALEDEEIRSLWTQVEDLVRCHMTCQGLVGQSLALSSAAAQKSYEKAPLK